jgi:hypothetical protein
VCYHVLPRGVLTSRRAGACHCLARRQDGSGEELRRGAGKPWTEVGEETMGWDGMRERQLAVASLFLSAVGRPHVSRSAESLATSLADMFVSSWPYGEDFVACVNGSHHLAFRNRRNKKEAKNPFSFLLLHMMCELYFGARFSTYGFKTIVLCLYIWMLVHDFFLC